MPAPTDLNSQIAFKKGWTWNEELHICSADRGYAPSHWRDPEGEPAVRPDFVGTLEGMSELMRDLCETGLRFRWYWVEGPSTDPSAKQFVCYSPDFLYLTRSPFEHSGVCLGEMWVKVRGQGWWGPDGEGWKEKTKEAANAGTD